MKFFWIHDDACLSHYFTSLCSDFHNFGILVVVNFHILVITISYFLLTFFFSPLKSRKQEDNQTEQDFHLDELFDSYYGNIHYT